MSPLRSACLSVLGSAALALAVPAGASAITEYPVEAGAATGAHHPQYIVAGAAGTLWYTDAGTGHGVAEISTLGEPILRQDSPAPSGDLAYSGSSLAWVSLKPVGSSNGGGYSETGNGSASAAKISVPYATAFTGSGGLRLTAKVDGYGFQVCDRNFTCFGNGISSRLTDLTLGKDGRMWAMQPEADLARRTTNAAATAFDPAVVNFPIGTRPGRAALGADGNLWVAGFGSAGTRNRLIRVTPTGGQTQFLLPPGRGPNDIAAGPDGALWFTEYTSQSIGRMTTSGVYTSYPLRSGASKPLPYGIVAGSDGAMWFTEYAAGKIGRLVPGEKPYVEPGAPTAPGVGSPIVIKPVVTRDRTKPALGRLGISRRTFRAARSGASISASKAKVGTKLSFRLSERGAVTFTVDRKTTGRRSGKRCLAKRRSNAARKRCTRYVKLRGSFRVAGKAGRNGFTFRGRLARRALKPGAYRLMARAADQAKNVSSPRTTTFRIVR